MAQSPAKRSNRLPVWFVPLLAAGAAGAMLVFGGLAALTASAQTAVGLGTATPFAVLAGTTVTNTGPSVISGDLGVDPGSAIVGFPPGVMASGTQYSADSTALQAESDLTTAYNTAAGAGPTTSVPNDLSGLTLVPGVYTGATSPALALTGTVTLNGEGNPDAVFIFQAGSSLTTASGSTVSLEGGAQACNVFWQVGSSAVLGTGSSFVGTIMALTSATVGTGTSVVGRVLARNGEVSLDDDTITNAACSTTAASPSPTASATPSATTTPVPGASPSGAGPGGPGSLTNTPSPKVPGVPGTGAAGNSPLSFALLAGVGGLGLLVIGAAIGAPARRRAHASRTR